MQLRQQPGELQQYLVTGHPIVDLIDQRKPVYIDKENGVLRALQLSVTTRPAHLVQEHVPVDQLGQGVVITGKAQGFLCVF